MKLISSFFRSPPKLKKINWGSLKCLSPVSQIFGLDRGQPIDRYYIERFLDQNRSDIRGNILEFGDATYAAKFCSTDAHIDVIHPVSGNPNATIVGDIVQAKTLPQNFFDCIIATQTFQFIYEIQESIKNIYNSLAPNGVLLATVSGISQISRYDMDRWGDYWRLTPAAAKKLFGGIFEDSNVSISMHGNALVATAFIQGVAVHELTIKELDHIDENYPVIITIRALKLSHA